MFLLVFLPQGVALTIRQINNNPKPLDPSLLFINKPKNILCKDIDMNLWI